MPSFDQAWAAASAACDSVFGDGANGIEFVAKARENSDPNGRPVADATRPTFRVDGIFSEASDSGRPEGRGISSTNTHRLASGRPSVLISVAMTWAPKAGDKVRLVNRTPIRSFEIVEIHRHEGGTLFEVTEL